MNIGGAAMPTRGRARAAGARPAVSPPEQSERGSETGGKESRFERG